MEKYKVEELIGEGSFGSVYLVRNEQGEKFAYKRIKIDPFQAEEAEREIDIMKRFTHQHLVQIYQHHFEEEKEELHIIIEYCEGGDLSHYLKKNKNIPAAKILSILKQIVTAFVAMSAKGVMHRDLKPENILLTKNDLIKIADFGCAKQVDINNLSVIDSRSMEKGTYLYVSPQQLRLEKYSFKCDVWAAGCIAYLLEYGHHPFMEANPHNVLKEIQKKVLNGPLQLPAQTDSSVATFIHLTLIYDDIQRASWRELQLCRIFAPKIKSVQKYIDYLRALSPMSNQIVKQFWKIHKNFNFPNYLDQILIYYLIKFQMNNLKMCLRLFKKMETYNYLFDPATYENYEPKEETFNQVKKSYLQYEKYFNSIKKTMETKECFTKFISPFEPKRVSSFVDLDKGIRTAYKILSWAKKQLVDHPCKDNKVWVLLSRWMNFEEWFSLEKEFSLEKMLAEPLGNVIAQISEELIKYENGSMG